MKFHPIFLAASLLTSVSGSLAMSEPAPSDAASAMVGVWEFSNADHDKTCKITFKLDVAGPGRALELDAGCAGAFPAMRDVVAWTIGKNEALQLIDARSKPLFELTEVENGMFESSRPGDPLYFLQTIAAAEGRERTADQLFGDWSFVRGSGKPICQISLLNTAADAESFALELRYGCDAAISSFAPHSWHMDRGLLVITSERGDAWRFEELDPTSWHRIPEGRQRLLLVR